MKLIKHRTNGHFKVSLFASAIALFVGAIPLPAGVIISAGSVTALAGSTGNKIDVDLTNTGPSAVIIGGFSLQLSLSGTAVMFASLSDVTATPYIFGGDSTFGPDISTSVTGGQASASDIYNVPLGGVTLASGATAGLADLVFSVAPLTPPGTFTLSIGAFPNTSVSDALGNNIPLQLLTAGQITIPGQPLTDVPEPSAFFGMTTALLVFLAAYGRRL